MKSLIDALKEAVSYNPETGEFVARTTKGRRKAGQKVGYKTGHRDDYPNPAGTYLGVTINRKIYLLHRLAWLFMTGKWPEGDIDHINGIPGDNRFCNLRDVATRYNCQNRTRVPKHSKTGFLGVHLEANGKFLARIVVDGKQKKLGRFKTAQDAHEAYVAAKLSMHNIKICVKPLELKNEPQLPR